MRTTCTTLRPRIESDGRVITPAVRLTAEFTKLPGRRETVTLLAKVGDEQEFVLAEDADMLDWESIMFCGALPHSRRTLTRAWERLLPVC